MVVCNGLKLLTHDNRYIIIFDKQGYEEKLLERLDQARLDVLNNPKKIQKTAYIGIVLCQTLYFQEPALCFLSMAIGFAISRIWLCIIST